MEDFKLTSFGDIIVNKDITVINECDELAQSVRNIIGTRYGEFVLYQDCGTVWDNMLGKDYNKRFLQNDIMNAIEKQETRITSISDIEIIEKKDRQLQIKIMFLADDFEREVVTIVG